MENNAKISFITKFKKSVLGDKDFFRDITRQSFSKAFSYILLVTLLTSIVFGLYHGITVNNRLGEWINKVDSPEYPSFTIEEGMLTADISEPIIYENINLKEIGVKDLHLVIDTTGTYTLNNLAGYNTGLLITDKRIILSQAGLSPQSIEFSEIDFTFSNEDLLDLLYSLKKFIFLIIIPSNILFAYIALLFKSLIASLFGLIIKNVYSVNIRYVDVLKIVFYAFTLPMILAEIMGLMPSVFIFNYKQFIFFIISGFYIIRGIKANATIQDI